MNDEERYLFDLMGYLVVDDVLTAAEVAELNALLDQRDLWNTYQREEYNRYMGNEGNLHVGWPHTWEEPFRRLVDQPRLRPYLLEMIGSKFRFDHAYAILMRQGGSQHRLHGGNTPYDSGQFYNWRNGQMYNGLVVVSYALGDVNPGDGGFACTPGSHKSNLPCPDDIKYFREPVPG